VLFGFAAEFGKLTVTLAAGAAALTAVMLPCPPGLSTYNPLPCGRASGIR